MQTGEFEFFTTDTPARASAPASPLQRLQYLVDNTPAIIYATVPSGDFKMTFVSNNAFNVLGYRPQDMVADPNFWFDHIHPDDAPQIFSSLAAIFSEGERTYEYRFRTADGRYLWMHDQLRLVRDEQGAPLEVIGSLTDITDRKQLETAMQAQAEQLLRAEKMASVGQLAAGIAHEINNPVGFVNSNLGTLQGYVGTLFGVIDAYHQALAAQPGVVAAIERDADLAFVKEDAAALVTESLDGLRRVKDIVRSLKDFSHVNEAAWQAADLHEGLDNTLKVAANEIGRKATVQKHYGKLPLVHCLAPQLNQVFLSLLLNAAQAIKGQGIIRIITGTDKEGAWVRIQDNGVGIPQRNLGRIFEPFFTTRAVGSGTGLGLSLSYGIVNKHGGRIDVVSEEGKGSAFTVHLPLAGGAPASAS